jgi:hypothetical protein
MYPRSAQVSAGIWLHDVEPGRTVAAYDEPVENPQWSPEAGAWAFERQDEAGAIYVLEPGGEATRVVSEGGSYPVWSPDGALISYLEGEKTSPDGWRLHVVGRDGGGDRALTERLPLLQAEPPVPGPNAKRFWLNDGKTIGFTRAGTDYGKAEQAGPMQAVAAGDDIENLWLVPIDASMEPRQATDLTRVFYLKDVVESPAGGTVGLVAFSYLDRAMQLWSLATEGGSPEHVDGPVRWYHWLGD